MSKAKKQAAAPARPASWLAWLEPRRLFPLLALAVIIFYWTPLFDDQATIQWDTADAHYSAQKYFEESVRGGRLPHWTPYVFAGMPFLADPQVAAWYPLHWPFFAAGITPRALEWEVALHAWLALAGMFLLARAVLGEPLCALLAAAFYGFSGFFAAHSSHLGMFETAALLPWLLWTAHRALDSNRLAWIVGTGMIGGLVVLAGHFQTALYSFFALVLFAAARHWRRAIVLLPVTALIAFLLSAIQVLPGLELTAQSVRAAVDYRAGTNAPLSLSTLITLLLPNYYGAVSGEYKGPPDITQFYFYQGWLLVPLVIVGLRRRALGLALAFIGPAFWYALGPGAGLYSVLTLLPGFRSVRAPVHIWFVIALGLGLLAAAGCDWLRVRYRRPWIPFALLAVSLADLWYWNMSSNQLAYARASFAERYGNLFDNFQTHMAPLKQKPLYRIWAPYGATTFGPLNSSLDARTEVTYGYNPLALARYVEYLKVAETNPKLLNGLGVTHKIDLQRGPAENPSALPRVSVPAQVQFVAGRAEAMRALATLDPAQLAVVEAPPRAITQDPDATVNITNYDEQSLRVRYHARIDTLLRIAVPYFPGWRATVDGRELPVYPVDLAIAGVIVPAGDHELVYRFTSRWFATGAGLSLAGALCAAVFLSARRNVVKQN